MSGEEKEGKTITSTATTTRTILLQGNAYENFVNAIKSKESERTYTFALRTFIQFQKVEYVSDLLSSTDPKMIEAKIITWIVNMKKKQQISPSTISTYLSAIIFFYAMNDVSNLNQRKIKQYLPEKKKQHDDRAYTREEISQLLQFCDERERALVLLLASSGMRIGAVPDLKIKHLLKIPQYGLYQVTVYEGLHEEYYCFTTPEAAKAIDTYLEYRERQGEKISQDAPLFRQQFDVKDLLAVNNPKSMDKRVLADLIRQKIHRSGLMTITPLTEGKKPGKKRNSIKRAHGFRKFLITTMVNARINETVINKLTGHSTGNQRAYYKPQLCHLLDEYLKCVDDLTINEHRLKRKVAELTIKNRQA